MARIVYKEGCEWQNKINAIEGIEIGLDNGRKALIFPKYAKLKMTNRDFDLEDWNAEEMTMEQVMASNGGEENEELYRINSPAAKFVSQFRTFKWGARDLPNLRLAVEIQKQRKEIDRQAEKIDGADLLRENLGSIWSCAREFGDSCYIAQIDGTVATDIVCNEHVCIPCVLNCSE